MVRADDEQEPEPTAPQITVGNKPPTASADDSTRQTSLPPWAMHWWVPLLLAGILLVAGCFLASIWHMPLRSLPWWTVKPYWPPSWPFNYHWPSKDAMALCATIAGAGFAFSAWQQRSHDNAAREQDKLSQEQAESRAREEREKQRNIDEKRRLEQIERDEYWKRREHIFQLLGSKNPGLRLGAVALLAELADSTAHTTLLNKAEKQQLQRHIIDTLCLQLRHEGLQISDEGNKDEHAEIQHMIMSTILTRINKKDKNNYHAKWDSQTIQITKTRIATPITICDLTTKSTLDFSHSIFEGRFEIQDSKVEELIWSTATFHDHITIKGKHKQCIINTNSLPEDIRSMSISNTTLTSDTEELSISINKSIKHAIAIAGSKFTAKKCACLDTCTCKRNTTNHDCLCKAHDSCNCLGKCINITVSIYTNQHAQPINTEIPPVTLLDCTMASLSIYPSTNQPPIAIEYCTITKWLHIQYAEDYSEQAPSIKSTYYDHSINIYFNTFYPYTTSPPIMIEMPNSIATPEPISFDGNMMINPNDPDDRRTLATDYSPEEEEPYLFFEFTSSPPQARLFQPWASGGKF